MGGELTEDDQVLGDTGVDDVHGPHGTAGVVEDPLLIEVDVVLGTRQLAELVDDVLHNGPSVVSVGSDAALRQVVEVRWLEDVE